MSRTGSLLLALTMLGAMAGCKSSAEPAAAEDSVFVKTMAELRRIGADPALDSAERDSAREATLRSHGVSAAELEDMARALAEDPKQALEAWREIEQQSRDTTSRAPAVRKSEIR